MKVKSEADLDRRMLQLCGGSIILMFVALIISDPRETLWLLLPLIMGAIGFMAAKLTKD